MMKQYQLKNKLKVLLVPSHKAPVVAVQMWVKTGSADERKKEEGISHFIEHLVFKGTRKFGVGEIAQRVEGSGGELNAYTTFDQTVFYVTMSRDDLDVGLEVISEMMGHPRFDPVEVDKEREVVIEEIKRSNDNMHRVSSQMLFSTVFKKHPYKYPIIGFDKNIREVSVAKLKRYFEERYATMNMCLVVSGDFEMDEIKQRIETHFGDMSAIKYRKVARPKEPAQKSQRFSYLATPFHEASLNIAFPIPKVNHKDIAGIDLISFILSNGDTSRLVKKLRLEAPLVNAVSVGAFNAIDPGFLAFSVSFQVGNISAIMEIIEREMQNIVSSPIGEIELSRGRLNMEADEIFSLETVDALARKVGWCQTLLGDPGYMEKYLKQLHDQTPEGLLKIARTYIDPTKMTATLMVHEKDKDVLTEKSFHDFMKSLTSKIKEARKVKVKVKSKKVKNPRFHVKLGNSKQSPLVKHRLSSGALLVIKNNPDLPILDIKTGFLGGVRMEQPKISGATQLMSSTWTSGTKSKSEDDIANSIEGIGGSLTAFGGRNTVGLSLETLKAYKKPAIELYSDVLLHPSFPEEPVQREIQIQKHHIKSRADHPSSIAGKLFMEEMFKGHPYSQDMLGDMESLGRITGKTLHGHWSEMVSKENAVFVALGDVNETEMIDLFEDLSARLPHGKKRGEPLPISDLHESKRVFHKLDKEQSHIIVGYRGLTITDRDRYVLDILESILAGQGGRLFLELRDKHSLAYSVSPVQMQGIETGYFGVYIGCSPEKGGTALKKIDEEIQKLLNHAPTESEIERAKRYLIGRNHIDLQKNASQANSILFDEIYGIDSQEAFRFADNIRSIEAKDVFELSRRILRGPTVISAVGPVEPWA